MTQNTNDLLREQARRSDGTFGERAHTAPDVALPPAPVLSVDEARSGYAWGDNPTEDAGRQAERDFDEMMRFEREKAVGEAQVATPSGTAGDLHERASQLYRDFYSQKVAILTEAFPPALAESAQRHFPGAGTITIERRELDGSQDFFISAVTYPKGRVLERSTLEASEDFDDAEQDITVAFRKVMQNDDDMQTAGGSRGQYTARGRDYVFDVTPLETV